VPYLNAPQPHVLLIDDSIVDLRLLLELMSAHKIRVSVAMEGRDGVNKALVQLPDLILLDVCMPGTDGLAVCRLLKASERTRDIPVIFLSVATDVEQRITGLTLGAVDYINKPFDPKEVLTRVSIHLNIARRLRAPAMSAIGGTDDSLEPTTPKPDHALVLAAVAELRKAMDAPPSPEQLAHMLGTNEKRLTRAFQAHFAMPVQAWLREERFVQARALLTTTSVPVATIAQNLGYSNQGNFTRAFRERFGCTPRDLRHSVMETEATNPR